MREYFSSQFPEFWGDMHESVFVIRDIRLDEAPTLKAPMELFEIEDGIVDVLEKIDCKHEIARGQVRDRLFARAFQK